MYLSNQRPLEASYRLNGPLTNQALIKNANKHTEWGARRCGAQQDVRFFTPEERLRLFVAFDGQ